MVYTQEFLNKLHAAFGEDSAVTSMVEKGADIAMRYLNDNTPSSIHYKDILNATSLEELKEKARHIELKNEVYNEFRFGECYAKEDVRRKKIGCPRLYGQNTNNRTILDTFTCFNVSHIPDCPKFKTGECWKRFDELILNNELKGGETC